MLNVCAISTLKKRLTRHILLITANLYFYVECDGIPIPEYALHAVARKRIYVMIARIHISDRPQKPNYATIPRGKSFGINRHYSSYRYTL